MLLDQNNITGPAAVIMMEIQGTEQHAMAAVAGSQLRLELSHGLWLRKKAVVNLLLQLKVQTWDFGFNMTT